MSNKPLSISNVALPIHGCSRWSQFKPFSPFSRETFRKLSIAGLAPQPIRMGIRMTMYSNVELHRFLADPLNYRVKQHG